MSPSQLILAIGFALVGLAWLGLSATALLGLRSMPALPTPSEPSVDQPAPSVALILAARDEATRVEQTVRRALAQRGVSVRVIVVDDRSVDETPVILARLAQECPRLRVVRVDALPPGWLGKCHALHVGAQRAEDADWLLFIDADTWLHPHAAAVGVALGRRDNAGHVCFAPSMAQSTLLGRATLLAGMLLYAVRTLSVHTPRLGGYMGVGAYNLIKAPLYRAMGGHEALRMDILDDVKLALLANRAGACTRTALAPDLVEVEWAGSARGFINLLRKNAFASQNYSLLRTTAVALIALAMLLTPLGALVTLALAPSSLERAFAGVCLLAWISTLLPAAHIARVYRWDWRAVALAPWGFWVVLAAGLNSALHTLRAHGVRWRDTFYPLTDLRRGIVR